MVIPLLRAYCRQWMMFADQPLEHSVTAGAGRLSLISEDSFVTVEVSCFCSAQARAGCRSNVFGTRHLILCILFF
jgi:hypothetical protein